MQLGTRARYTVEAIIDLAVYSKQSSSENSSVVSISVLSKRLGISVNYLEQLFSKLRRSGMVDSIYGSKGGYRIAKSLDKITLLDIVKATSEGIETRGCKGRVDDGIGCRPNFTKCYSHHLWDGLLNTIHEYLEGITLDKICKEYTS